MFQAIEAEIDTSGTVNLLEKVNLTRSRKALVIILDIDFLPEDTNQTAMLSEISLAKDWECPEEDEAWTQFQ